MMKLGYFFKNHIYLTKNSFVNSKSKTDKAPITVTHNGNTYTLIYNGNIYNIEDIKKELLDNGFEFFESSVAEILLKAFIHFGYDTPNHLNGAFSFAIWNEFQQELFLARDHFGIKPLYYSIINNTLVFSSEIKSILKFPEIQTIINSQGISELFGIGPSHTPGVTLFKNIFEIKPAHFAVFNNSGLHINRYWKLQSKEHIDSFDKTCLNIYDLLGDSIRKQLISDTPICSMLSGGLDSSIITAYVSNYYKDNGMPPLNTYSVDYLDNDINFIKNDFQPDSDKFYIDIMKNKFRYQS
ncbi:MAG: hypothetical protein IKT41_05730 [Clostridia bacterium]|nr:hypothetical protein [Clostridia bacterium]